MDVFLSASVPSATGDERFLESADPLLIREAVKALVEVVLPNGRLVFGGHPAITPLIAIFLEQFQLEPERLTVFQSAYFEPMFPSALDKFFDVRIIDMDPAGRAQSLEKMRRAMLTSRCFEAGVFIGGMQGVIDEARMFRDMYPAAKFLPVASAGGAAAVLYESDRSLSGSLANELTYRTLFRRLL